jgi:hypothetical protein
MQSIDTLKCQFSQVSVHSGSLFLCLFSLDLFNDNLDILLFESNKRTMFKYEAKAIFLLFTWIVGGIEYHRKVLVT